MKIAADKIFIAIFAILLLMIASPSAYADDDHHKLKFKLENEIQEDEARDSVFEIDGEISAVVGNNFVVSGQTIFIDLIHVTTFKQKGILEVGKRVKVKGIIVNGVKLAQDINVIGTGQGRFKIETDNHPLKVGTTANSNIQIKINSNKLVGKVDIFFNQIATLLKNLIS